MDPQRVFVEKTALAEYPGTSPFHPDQAYPEYQFGDLSAERNSVYATARECLRRAGLDTNRFGTPEWNPLGGLINYGETVLLKPNLIKESHPRDPDGWRYVITHGSVVRAVADYVWKAVGAAGKVIIADAPQTDSSFSEIVKVSGLDTLCAFYSGLGLQTELLDLRREEWISRDGVVVERRKLNGDPYGTVPFDLADSSAFDDHTGGGRYYGADYDAGETNLHHREGRHEYLLARVAVDCDVFFNLPKLKTHKKAGITVALKNLVGINGDKNWLPHHTEGSPASGGDEHPNYTLGHQVERIALRNLQRLSLRAPAVGTLLNRHAHRAGARIFGDSDSVVRNGNWYGNDTIWRMCLDLNKLVFYGVDDGTLRAYAPANRKRHYTMVDGIIAGEGRGPMNPDPVAAGLIAFGSHPASVDAACACLMGFDPDLIPIVREAFRQNCYPLAEWHWRDVEIVSNRREWCGQLPSIDESAFLHFEPHFGWKGHIEKRRSVSVRRA